MGSIVATSALGAALVSLAPGADAAPYPPTQPCSLTATARGPASDGGTTSYDVLGSGLGPEQPVRVVQVATGQQVGSAQTDENGNFRTIVTAPADADASAPDLTASSPRQTCTSSPPPGTTSPTPSSARPNPTNTLPTRGTTSTGSGAGNGTGTGGTGGAGGTGGNPVPSGAGGSGPGAASSGSASGGSSPTGGAGDGTSAPTSSAPATSGTNSTAGRTSSAPLAEPSPGTETPFGIGLGIAAILLVLGTLAVLLLTRRPER